MGASTMGAQRAQESGGEAAELRRALRDLVALSALPAIWAGNGSDAIADGLADTLIKLLQLRFAFLRLPASIGGERRDVLRFDHDDVEADGAAALLGAIEPPLRDPFKATASISNPLDGSALKLAICRFGQGGETGAVVAGSPRADFPTERERTLLAIAAGQAALAIRQQRVDEECQRLFVLERGGREEAQLLNDLARTLGAELELEPLLQKVTDAATELTAAQFGAYFHNANDEQGEQGELCTHFTLSGAPRSAFANFPPPRNTALFGPTFRDEGVVRIDDVLADPRYGKCAPHFGMPQGLPVRSYLAVPVISRRGEVLGGLFFGHELPAVFSQRAERLALGVAGQAGVAIDNAQLYARAQKEIEERRRAEESERAARTEVERAARVRDDFLAIVSHELRTPLNGMLGWSEVLRRTPADDAEIRERAIDAISRGARAQARLIDDLLDMSRVISGKLRLDVQTVELPPLVHAAIETMRPAAEAKQIRIEPTLDPFSGLVKGDPARLQQVLWNLLSNAVKFTSKDGRVSVRLERVDTHVQVTVADTGRGIEPEFLPFVFDRFRQADSSTTRHEGGLGLGLAIVKNLVELHGGRVHASSEGKDRGATFTVRLPLAVALQGAPALRLQGAASPIDADGPLPRQLDGVRILVVDDDRDACELLQRVLGECNARVVIASSAAEALRLLADSRPDVLVSDIGMPDRDGYALIRELRARGDQIPAVAVTAFARSEDRVRVLRAGYNMHVAKPLEPRELIEVISSLVRGGRA